MEKISFPRTITLQDWGITYDELEPYFDKFEKTAGISGDDKNPFAGKRSSDLSNACNEKNTYC